VGQASVPGDPGSGALPGATWRDAGLALSEAIVLLDPEGLIVDCNPAAERILGRSRTDLLGTGPADAFEAVEGEDGRPLPADGYPSQVAIRTGLPCREVVMRVHLPGGASRWLLVNAEPLLRDGAARPYAVVDSFTDITDLRTTREELAESEERFRLAFEEAMSGMTLMGVDPASPGRFLRVNRAFCDFLGYSAAELTGLSFEDITLPDDLPAARAAVHRFVIGEVPKYRSERRYLHASGATVWAAFSIAMVHGADGSPRYAVGMFEDITARKRAEQDLVFRALHDDLTGLPNRALLLDHLEGALARARRNAAAVGVLFLDLDDFKAINDSHGHQVGDEFLRRVAERIAGSLRAGDTAARIGGDEFVVVCESLPDPAEAGLVAERIRQALGADIPLREHSVAAPVSIGIAVSSDGSTAESLLRDADAAMYVAKRAGGHRWEPAGSGLRAASFRVLAVENELRRALVEDQLRIHYQPVYALGGGRPVAVEALLRWQHPHRDLLVPAEFLQVAEQRGLMDPIGDLVLATACAEAARWRDRYGDAAPTLCVNVSSRQLGGQRLSSTVTDLLARTRLPAQRLCLEIGEGELSSIGTAGIVDLDALATAGVRLAVDDFGAGYAGFQYLRRLPVHELKIDVSFVAGLDVDPTDTAIIAGMITLGRSLGLTVVAEGVETPQQLARLRALGCDRGQGWLWAPAVPAEELDALLAQPGPAWSAADQPGPAQPDPAQPGPDQLRRS
jgi:diguanylate cyclase (GGDEF)-like protein/PAS domain S-box-containing protein